MAKPAKERIPALEACIADLNAESRILKKRGGAKRRDGSGVLDVVLFLKDIIKYGIHGGKVPYAMNRFARAIFEEDGVEDFIQEPRPRKSLSKFKAVQPFIRPEPKRMTFLEAAESWRSGFGDYELEEFVQALRIFRERIGLQDWQLRIRPEAFYVEKLDEETVAEIKSILRRGP